MRQIHGSKELVRDVHQKGICAGCGGCIGLCPYLKNHKGQTTMLFPCALSEGRCYAHCPMTGVDLGELSAKIWDRPYEGSPLGPYQEILASRAGNKMTRGAFQAGGTVTALMTFALNEQIIDAAVLTDMKELIPVPRLVTEPGDIVKCAGSKFMAAPTLAALNQGVKEGYRNMGVVGTPCQSLSAAQMRCNPLDKDDFCDPVAFMIGLFCTWAVDTRGLISLLSAYADRSRILGMDLPPPPSEVMVIRTDEKKVEIPLEKIRPLILHSCGICPDMTTEWADVSVGVLEGQPEWNTIIVRTSRGEQMVNAARRAGYLIAEKIPSEKLHHLYEAAEGKKKRAVTRSIQEGLLNSSTEERPAALRMPGNIVQKIMTDDREEICQS